MFDRFFRGRWICLPSKNKMSDPALTGNPGAGSGPAPEPAPMPFRDPTFQELFEIKNLIMDPAKTADDMLAWLKAHPDVRSDYIQLDKEKIPRYEPLLDERGRLKARKNYDGKSFSKSKDYSELQDFFGYHGASFLGQVFVGARDIPLSSELAKEVLSRYPDFTQKDRGGDTLLQKLETQRRTAKGKWAQGDPAEIQSKINFLHAKIQGSKKALRVLPVMGQLAEQKGLPPEVGSLIAAQVAPVSAADSLEKQRNVARMALGMRPKGGRRTRRNPKKRQTRRRRAH